MVEGLERSQDLNDTSEPTKIQEAEARSLSLCQGTYEQLKMHSDIKGSSCLVLL